MRSSAGAVKAASRYGGLCRFFAAIAPVSQRHTAPKILQDNVFINKKFIGTCIVCHRAE